MENDLTGKRFGRLTVICRNGVNNHRAIIWSCLCDCGKTVDVIGSSLRSGHTKSCGCLHRDIKTKHGEYDSRLYRVWNSMKQRCDNPNNHNYKWYGAKGIRVCGEWKEFNGFRNWAVANGYDSTAQIRECTLDRISNNGDYEPSNCRWISMAEQNRNKSYHRYVEYKGEVYTVTQLAAKVGMNKDTLVYRLNANWSVDDAINKPIRKRTDGAKMEEQT
jgi:hypothetical protein